MPESMAGVKERLTGAIATARERVPVLDHTIRTVGHYSSVNGSLQAAGVTYAAFLSFFPILALGFAVVGYAARWLPDGADAEANLVAAIKSVFPGLIGDGPNEISLDTFRSAAPAILSIGLPLAVWSGLGWLSSMRTALLEVFALPSDAQPNWLFGKLRDVTALVALGGTLFLAVAVSGVVGALSERILGLVDLEEFDWVLASLVPLVGIAANAVLFFAMYQLLARPQLPRRSLWAAAAIGAVGFEVLKQLSAYLLKSTAQQPAFQAFGIALVLLVWINYFTQLVLYTAAWAQTSDDRKSD
ncbi:YihY/virulence factor BrkB family protein [Nocardioides cavernaquae]|nr:YihY/virulence factor BrkB family protein [Nocardioides cavernaquae]